VLSPVARCAPFSRRGIHDVLSKSLARQHDQHRPRDGRALKQLEEPRVAARRGLPFEDVPSAHPRRGRGPDGRDREGRCVMAARLKVTQIKSKISEKQNQRDTLRSLGLKRIGDVVVREDNKQNRGYVNTVAHLVKVEEID
jgi:large subunit ribosomal protein L30